MRKPLIYLVLGVVVAGPLLVWFTLFREPSLKVDAILATYEEGKSYGGLTIRYPFDGAVFPPEIVPPAFQWEDTNGASDAWLVTIQFEDGQGRMSFESRQPEWTPSDEQWETIQRRSVESKAQVTILGVHRARQETVLSAASIVISTSKDAVGAPVFYREVNLPFIEAVKDPSRIRWRLGDVASPQPPAVVLEQLPVCGNCHSFSADAATLGMDVDYANDKGSYAILPVADQMVLDPGKIITWADYRREDREPTFGLLSQVSPDGRYVVSTVKDRSVFVPREELAYSQLFFPIKGILAFYDRHTKKFQALPGADDPEYVQSNPAWSPDGKQIVFARSKAYRLRNDRRGDAVLLTPEECKEFLSEGKTFLFDLYRIPFEGGKGGRAEPLAGASHNGMSNYFAKYSPDGKWIVFCKARSFMLLQPDSELYLLPAEGGEARRLSCNLAGMNSWHSWSPNGRWLVFSSKALSLYTQLFLAHIDQYGRSSPAVLLRQFTAPDRAANIPEFVNAAPGRIREIREQFLNDHHYVRASQQDIFARDFDRAEAACRKALELNPKSADALGNLGIVLIEKGMVEEAETCLTRAVESEPGHLNNRLILAGLLSRRHKLQEGIVHYREALRIHPDLFDAHLPLGVNLLDLGKPAEATEHLAAAVRLRPNHATAQYHLGLALERQQKLEEAAAHYTNALAQKPDFVPALLGLASIRTTAKDPGLRNPAEAVRLAERACALSQSKDAESLATLAAAYAGSGRYAEAIPAARRAIQLARQARHEPFARAIQQRLEQYEQQSRP